MDVEATNTDDAATTAAQRMRRFANDSIYAAAQRRGLGTGDFLCECGQLDCNATVSMPLAEFDEGSPAGTVLAHNDC